MVEYTTVDKSGWGDGPWQHEPDKINWTDPATGLPCMIVRNRIGALCGYVGVHDDHPWHGKDYGDVDVEVHGGLTFAAACQEGPIESTIWHAVADGEPDDVWWFGFDCGHLGDVMPELDARLRTYELPPMSLGSFEFESYKTVDYVTAEVTALARQLHAVR
jgi:hypothetical protein